MEAIIIPIATSVGVSGLGALYTYFQSKKLKRAETKISIGGEQLIKILEEKDTQIKYVYKLQNICTEFRQVLCAIYNRQYQKQKTKFKYNIKINFYYFDEPLTIELYEKLNKVNPELWKKNFKEEFKNTIKPWEWKDEFKIINTSELIMILYSLSKIMAWIEIKKKDDKSIHAYASQKGKIKFLLNKFVNTLNLENDRKINIPILLQKEIGQHMIKNESDDNLMHSLNFLEFKDFLYFNDLPLDDREKIKEIKKSNENSTINPSDVLLKDINLVLFDQKETGDKNRIFNYGIINDGEKKERIKNIESILNFNNLFYDGKPSVIKQLEDIFDKVDNLKNFFLVDVDFYENYLADLRYNQNNNCDSSSCNSNNSSDLNPDELKERSEERR